MNGFNDVETDGEAYPLVWHPDISGEKGVVTPIALEMLQCGNPCYKHFRFVYLTDPGFLPMLLGARYSIAVATRYHACMN